MGKKQLFTQKDLEELNEELSKHLNLGEYKGMYYRNMKFDVGIYNYNSLTLEYGLMDKTREEYEKEYNEIGRAFEDSEAEKTINNAFEEDKINQIWDSQGNALSANDIIRTKIQKELQELRDKAIFRRSEFRVFESKFMDLCRDIPKIRAYIEDSQNDTVTNYTANKVVEEINNIIELVHNLSDSLMRIDCNIDSKMVKSADEIIDFQMKAIKEEEAIPEVETAGIGFLDRDENALDFPDDEY